MKNTLVTLGVLAAMIIGYAAPSSAAALDVQNGGLGQVASNPEQFGVAVCDKSDQPLTGTVPITVAVGDQSTTISSVDSIGSGQCEYSYIPYSQFGMQAGQTYSVNVTVGDDQTTYTVTVPAQPANPLTADIGSFFSWLWNWFVGLFKYL